MYFLNFHVLEMARHSFSIPFNEPETTICCHIVSILLTSKKWWVENIVLQIPVATSHITVGQLYAGTRG